MSSLSMKSTTYIQYTTYVHHTASMLLLVLVHFQRGKKYALHKMSLLDISNVAIGCFVTYRCMLKCIIINCAQTEKVALS